MKDNSTISHVHKAHMQAAGAQTDPSLNTAAPKHPLMRGVLGGLKTF